MTTTHHTPPTPGAIRSIIAPHMGVHGNYRDMLSQDLQMATGILRQHEADLEDTLLAWQNSTGGARVVRRAEARLEIAYVERWRRFADAALLRLAAHGEGGRMAA